MTNINRFLGWKNVKKKKTSKCTSMCMVSILEKILFLTWVPHIPCWAAAPCCGGSIGTNLSVGPNSPALSLAVGQPATGGALSAADATLHWGLLAPQRSLATASEGSHRQPDAWTHHGKGVTFKILISSKFSLKFQSDNQILGIRIHFL